MIVNHINLKSFYPKILDHDLFLDSCEYTDNYEFNNTIRKNILVLPGGGYKFISEREKDPIMFAFLAKGYNTFSLTYSCNRAYPIPHIDVACAMHYIANHYKQQTIVVGFSAGGHLASTYGYIYKELAENKTELKQLKPYALILGYPVVSLYNNPTNTSTKQRVANNDSKLLKLLSTELHITSDYPPTFIFATKTDEMVNCNHSILLRNSLIKKKVKNKCIIYPNGPHGLALANEATYSNEKKFLNKEVSHWVDEAHEFIKSIKEK